MCRSSQPLVGLRGRSLEDERMIQCICDANPNADVMYMIDTRPKVSRVHSCSAASKQFAHQHPYTQYVLTFFVYVPSEL